MFGYMKIITPEGKRIRVAKTLYLKIQNKLADDQVYEFYNKFLTFLDNCPVRLVAILATNIYEKVDADDFLYRLNSSTDKEGNIDWKFFFNDIDFSE